MVEATFDTLVYADRLEKAGLDRNRVRAQAEALRIAFNEGVAMKADLRRIEENMATKIDIANLRADIQRELRKMLYRFAGIVIAVVGIARFIF